jgi:hypothetical protein
MSLPLRPWYLLTGLLIGVVLGVLYAWVITPNEVLETSPAMLRSDFKSDYRALIALAYQSSADLGRAEARLALLEDEDPARALAVQAQLTLGEEGGTRIAQALGQLAAAIQAHREAPDDPIIASLQAGVQSPSQATSTATVPPPVVRTATADPAGQPTATTTPSGDAENGGNPTPTITPTGLPTATATPGAPFVLLDIVLECNPNIDPPRIQVYVTDAAGSPVPGVAAVVSWDGNSNRFVTGLKPAFGLGYADFDMDPALSYSLRLEGGGEPVDNITGRVCEDAPEPYWGSWRFNFVQP